MCSRHKAQSTEHTHTPLQHRCVNFHRFSYYSLDRVAAAVAVVVAHKTTENQAHTSAQFERKAIRKMAKEQ